MDDFNATQNAQKRNFYSHSTTPTAVRTSLPSLTPSMIAQKQQAVKELLNGPLFYDPAFAGRPDVLKKQNYTLALPGRTGLKNSASIFKERASKKSYISVRKSV